MASYLNELNHQAAIPSLFGTRDRVHGGQFRNTTGRAGGWFGGWFECITPIVYFISLVTNHTVLPQIIRQTRRLWTLQHGFGMLCSLPSALSYGDHCFPPSSVTPGWSETLSFLKWPTSTSIEFEHFWIDPYQGCQQYISCPSRRWSAWKGGVDHQEP